MPQIIFIQPDGAHRAVDARIGDTLMAVAVDHDVQGIEGTCGGALACATCHIKLSDADLARFAPPGPEEEDMLDLAAGVDASSRLACQLVVDAAMDGLTVTVPPENL